MSRHQVKIGTHRPHCRAAHSGNFSTSACVRLFPYIQGNGCHPNQLAIATESGIPRRQMQHVGFHFPTPLERVHGNRPGASRLGVKTSIGLPTFDRNQRLHFGGRQRMRLRGRVLLLPLFPAGIRKPPAHLPQGAPHPQRKGGVNTHHSIPFPSTRKREHMATFLLWFVAFSMRWPSTNWPLRNLKMSQCGT
jgi:hypothetical protein